MRGLTLVAGALCVATVLSAALPKFKYEVVCNGSVDVEWCDSIPGAR